MEQNHPIPQQISSYQFRLVGDMTLKQFFELAGGVLVGIILYALPLNGFIKWPIIIFSVLLGAAMAFIPFEERPLERWIIAFFRSVYSPTLFSWSKPTVEKRYYQNETVPQPQQKVLAPQGVEAMNTYLATPTTSASFFTKLEAGEKNFLTRMGDLFGPGSPNKGIVSVTQTTTTLNTATPAPVSFKPTSFTPTEQVSKIVPHTEPKPSLEIPITPNISVPHESRTRLVVEETGTASKVTQTSVSPTPTSTNPEGFAPVFSPDAAPPNPPSIANTISGQVISPKGGIIEGAILEIRDISGRPVRALRTNKLGHFYIVTPLISGAYEIITEKDGFEFSPVKFEAEGNIIEPFAIKALREIITPAQIPNPSPTFTPAMQ